MVIPSFVGRRLLGLEAHPRTQPVEIAAIL
jgi:hypothetical protein